MKKAIIISIISLISFVGVVHATQPMPDGLDSSLRDPVRNVELLYPKTGDVLVKNKFYTIKWIPNFYDMKLQGTNIIAQAYLVNSKDGSEIPLSYGLIFSNNHLESQHTISIKASEYSKYQILLGKYKFKIKFSDLIPAKPCGVIESTSPEPPCVYGRQVNYGVIAEAESAGDVTIVEQTRNYLVENHTYTAAQLLNASSSVSTKVKIKAFVFRVVSCDPRSDTICFPEVYVSDSVNGNVGNSITLISHDNNPSKLIISKQYEFSINFVPYSGSNKYYLDSYKILDDDQNNNPPTISTNNETFLIHVWSWFIKLFKRGD
jgi:hypothetical protein